MIKEGKGKTDFHLDIQYTNPPLLGHVFHGLGAGTVVIPPELRMLNEPPSSTSARNSCFVVKLYSRPSCSPDRGARVVSDLHHGAQ